MYQKYQPYRKSKISPSDKELNSLMIPGLFRSPNERPSSIIAFRAKVCSAFLASVLNPVFK